MTGRLRGSGAWGVVFSGDTPASFTQGALKHTRGSHGDIGGATVGQAAADPGGAISELLLESIDVLVGGILPTLCDEDAFSPSVAVIFRKSGAYDIDAGPTQGPLYTLHETFEP